MSNWLLGEGHELLRTSVGRVVAAPVRNARTGREGEFYRFDFADWVNTVALTTDGELVCIRQYRFGTDREELEIPGGAIERGEDALAAGVRELMEETGYSGVNARIIGVVRPNPALQQNHCYTVLVEEARLVGPQRLDDLEDIEVFTMPLPEVQRCIDSGAIQHGLVLNALMFFFRGLNP